MGELRGEAKRLSASQLEYFRKYYAEALEKLADPSATLAQHDKRLAERCLQLFNGAMNFMAQQGGVARSAETYNVAAVAIRREFGLDTKRSVRAKLSDQQGEPCQPK